MRCRGRETPTGSPGTTQKPHDTEWTCSQVPRQAPPAHTSVLQPQPEAVNPAQPRGAGICASVTPFPHGPQLPQQGRRGQNSYTSLCTRSDSVILLLQPSGPRGGRMAEAGAGGSPAFCLCVPADHQGLHSHWLPGQAAPWTSRRQCQVTAPTPGWPGHPSRSYGTAGRQPEPLEDRTSGTLPDSWLSTPFRRNANSRLAGRRMEQGARKMGSQVTPGRPCSEHALQHSQAPSTAWTTVLLAAKCFHVCPFGTIFFSGHSNPGLFQDALQSTSP